MAADPRAGRRVDADRQLHGFERVYDEAVVAGPGGSEPTRAGDRTSSLELLAAITVHVPRVALLLVDLEDTHEPAVAACLAGQARRQIGGLLRLSHDALELDAREVGYRPGVWRRVALAQARHALTATAGEIEAELGLAVLELDRASVHLSMAISAWASDRTAVPSHLATAQGRWLSCHLRTRRCVAAATHR